MTAQQLRWAAQHDWYRGAELANGRYIVSCYESETDQVVKFTDFKTLYHWAGY